MILLGLGIISSISSIGYTIYNCSNIYKSYNKKKILPNANLFTDYEDINQSNTELNYLDNIEDKLDKIN